MLEMGRAVWKGHRGTIDLGARKSGCAARRLVNERLIMCASPVYRPFLVVLKEKAAIVTNFLHRVRTRCKPSRGPRAKSTEALPARRLPFRPQPRSQKPKFPSPAQFYHLPPVLNSLSSLLPLIAPIPRFYCVAVVVLFCLFPLSQS